MFSFVRRLMEHIVFVQKWHTGFIVQCAAHTIRIRDVCVQIKIDVVFVTLVHVYVLYTTLWKTTYYYNIILLSFRLLTRASK